MVVDRIDYLTILAKKVPSAYEALGHSPLGRVYFDDAQQGAHERFGVDVLKGAVVVLRPDGWIGTMAVLGEGTATELERYFERIFV